MAASCIIVAGSAMLVNDRCREVKVRMRSRLRCQPRGSRAGRSSRRAMAMHRVLIDLEAV
eukprot:2562529-Rhodomonas_salina.3